MIVFFWRWVVSLLVWLSADTERLATEPLELPLRLLLQGQPWWVRALLVMAWRAWQRSRRPRLTPTPPSARSAPTATPPGLVSATRGERPTPET
jgi:hypothetical protein